MFKNLDTFAANLIAFIIAALAFLFFPGAKSYLFVFSVAYFVITLIIIPVIEKIVCCIKKVDEYYLPIHSYLSLFFFNVPVLIAAYYVAYFIRLILSR